MSLFSTTQQLEYFSSKKIYTEFTTLRWYLIQAYDLYAIYQFHCESMEVIRDS
jgi:hypothetical protein